MLKYYDEDLPLAAEKGLLPEGTVAYARGIIELKIQGKPVAKTRKEWAEFLLPYRSYDSETTQGISVQTALLELESMNKAKPDLTLDELKRLILKKRIGRF